MTKKSLYFLAASHFSVDINSGSLPAILPFFVYNYGMDYTQIAGLMFASSFLSSIIQPVFGYMADKGSRQWFMGFGVIVAALSLTSICFMTDYWPIFTAVTVMGIASAIFHPEAARLVNLIAGKKKGSGMSIFSVGGNGGFCLGPLIAVALISAFGIHGLVSYGVFGLIMGTVLLFMAPKIRDNALSMKAKQDAELIRRNAESLKEHNTEANTDNATDTGLVNDWRGFSRLSAVILFRSTVYTAISSFLPLYCIQSLGATHAVGTSTLSILAFAGVFTTLIGGKLADRWGYVKTLRNGCLLLVPLLGLLVFSHNLTMVFALLIPMSLAMHGTYAPFVVLGQTYLAKSVGFASGVTMGLSFSLGGMMAPGLGRFGDAYGIDAVMVLVVALSACCAFCSLLLPQPKNKI